MSAFNGDRSRFHRLRKQKIRRRAAIRALRASLQTAKAATPAKSK